MKKHYQFVFLIVLGVSCANNKPTDFELRPLSPYTKDNSFAQIVQRYKYFLLLTKPGEVIPGHLVQQKVFSMLDSNYISFDKYAVIVYKKSAQTNEKYVESPSDIIEWHGDDIAFVFDWERGKYIGLSEYENGEVKNSNFEIKVLDSLPKQ